MKIIHKNQTKKFNNSESCVAIEYPMEVEDFNGTIVELSGRYPSKGRVVNLKCKEMSYVVEGAGKVVVEGKEISLSKGDLVLIESGEKYFWDGKLTLFVSCAPAWYPEQHKEVE